MHHMLAIPVIGLTCAGGLRAAKVLTVVPEQYRGTWASSAAHCAVPAAESKLTIHGNRIDFYESRGRFLAIATHGKNELALLVEASGEGETRLTALQFRLSEDGATLIDVTGGPTRLVRIRCKAVRR